MSATAYLMVALPHDGGPPDYMCIMSSCDNALMSDFTWALADRWYAESDGDNFSEAKALLVDRLRSDKDPWPDGYAKVVDRLLLEHDAPSPFEDRPVVDKISAHEPHEPVEPGTNRVHTWDEFSEAGMLWLANRTLHLFGWAIVVERDDNDVVTGAYPVRTEWRMFTSDREELGVTRVSEWMAKAAAAIREETGR